MYRQAYSFMITSIEEARKLPERKGYAIIERLDAEGRRVKEIHFRDIAAVERNENAILLFVDVDGRLMTVNYDSQGAYKTAVRAP